MVFLPNSIPNIGILANLVLYSFKDKIFALFRRCRMFWLGTVRYLVVIPQITFVFIFYLFQLVNLIQIR